MNKKIFTVPNLLSAIRIILIPFIVIFYMKKYVITATVLVLVSGISDMLDGYIARTFNQVSDLGKILDPIADKLTMVAVVFLVAVHHLPLRIMLCVLVGKELLMLLGALALFGSGARPCQAKIFGKLATLSLYITVFTVMLTDVIGILSGKGPILGETAVWIMSGVCCFLMLAALVQYTLIFIAIKQGRYDLETEKIKGAAK